MGWNWRWLKRRLWLLSFGFIGSLGILRFFYLRFKILRNFVFRLLFCDIWCPKRFLILFLLTLLCGLVIIVGFFDLSSFDFSICFWWLSLFDWFISFSSFGHFILFFRSSNVSDIFRILFGYFDVCWRHRPKFFDILSWFRVPWNNFAELSVHLFHRVFLYRADWLIFLSFSVICGIDWRLSCHWDHTAHVYGWVSHPWLFVRLLRWNLIVHAKHLVYTFCNTSLL